MNKLQNKIEQARELFRRLENLKNIDNTQLKRELIIRDKLLTLRN